MPIGQDLRKFTTTEVKNWAERKGLAPGRIKGTSDFIQLVRKGGTERVEEIDWDLFEDALASRGLAVYGTEEGWMRIMRKK